MIRELRLRTAGAELSSVSMDEIKEFFKSSREKLNKNILEEISAEKVQLERQKNWNITTG